MLYFCKTESISQQTMAIITLTSDWGTSDYYVAAVKGTILAQIPDATIVDITHEIDPFNLPQVGFTLRNCFRCFPQGTIHIIAVDTIESLENPHVVVKAEGQYFISTDNGIFSHILNEGKFEEAVYIDVLQDSDTFNFATRDRFVKVAAMIARGEPLSSIGATREKLNMGGVFCAVVRDNTIEGVVIHIDAYENLITNITKEMFERERRGRDFTIMVKGNLYTVDKISDSYLDVGEADLVAIFGSHGYLELALSRAKLASLCGIELSASIKVVFHDADEPQQEKSTLF
jgi:hypothetical protein